MRDPNWHYNNFKVMEDSWKLEQNAKFLVDQS